MGLDNFWKHPDATPTGDTDCIINIPIVEFNPPLSLCGGIFSGHGESSFRGKVYAEDFERLTGESLYSECHSNEKVGKIANTLKCVLDRNDPEETCDFPIAQFERMFRMYAQAGYELHGWW